MANKNCLIYETLNGVSDMQKVKKENGMMTLTGVFGVCGVRNNNKRVYETSNYAKMVQEMKSEIEKNNGIPGELEHPQTMNITLENISHKITDINIDENGLVTGSITLLNTPKGKIAQAIVEGGLPLFISSRATGQVDAASGNVTLEKIATYDLVGSPGFSQARLKLNENQVAESICESVYYVTDKINENNDINDMEMKEILEKVEALESRIEELEQQNEELREQVEESNSVDVKRLADSIQKWIVEEYSPMVQKWVVEEFTPENNNELMEEAIEASKNMFINEMADKIQQWVVEEFAPEVQNWVTEEYSPEIQNWIIEEFAEGVQNWVIEEYAPEVEKYMNENFMENVKNYVAEHVNESIAESKKNSLSSIDQTLQILESMETTKPTYSRKAIITENSEDEPVFIQNMPAEARVKWEMASEGVKESISRRARLYNFANEGAIERFWNNIEFNEVKPIQNVYEGLEQITDERERAIRASFRRKRSM